MKTLWISPLLTAWVLAVAVLVPDSARAQQMNYQGRLTDTNGTALLDGQYILTFNLYSAAAGGVPVWGPFVYDGNAGNGRAAKADLVNGRFNVILGPLDTAGRPLPPAFIGGTNRHLGIKVGASGSEISPRQQILAAPQALHAREADHAALADNATTANHATTASTAANFTSTVLFTDETNKRVGVGISAPAFTLEVVDPAAETGHLHVGGRGANGAAKLVSFGDSDLVYVGEKGQDDTMELRASRFYFNNGAVGIGVATPAARLDVRGDIKLGPSGEFQAAAAEEKLRIVRGVVLSSGTKYVGSGWSITAHTTGTYTIAFTTPFAGQPTITGNSTFNNPGSYAFVTILDQTSSGFVIETRTQSGGLQNYNIGFIAVGPR